MSQKIWTLDELLSVGLSGEHLQRGDAVELERDEQAGTARYRLPSALERRDLCLATSPPMAAMQTTSVDVSAVMTEDASGVDVAAVRDALRQWYDIPSGAEADRRVYRVVSLLLGLD